MSTRSALLFCSLAGLCAAAVSGCATSPVPLARSRPVAAKRLLAAYAFYDHPVHHGAKLVIVRDAARFDQPEDAQALVDGRAIAFLRPSERVEAYIYAGTRILGAGGRPGAFAGPLVNHPYRFEAGRTYLVRIGIRGGQFDIYPVTADGEK